MAETTEGSLLVDKSIDMFNLIREVLFQNALEIFVAQAITQFFYIIITAIDPYLFFVILFELNFKKILYSEWLFGFVSLRLIKHMPLKLTRFYIIYIRTCIFRFLVIQHNQIVENE